MERKKNGGGDFLIDGRLTIKELYELAKSEGFEDREMFFMFKNSDTGEIFSTDHVVDFGKGWGHITCLIHLKLSERPNKSSSL